MPEPVPTTEVNTEGKPKKLPKWALIAIIGGGVFALLLYKHKRQKEEEEKGSQFVEATTGGQTAEAVQPISSGGNLINAAHQMQLENDEFLKSALQEEEKKQVSRGRINQGKGRGSRGGRGTEITGNKGATRTEPPTEQTANIPRHKEQTARGTPIVGPKPEEEPKLPVLPRRRSSGNKLPISG